MTPPLVIDRAPLIAAKVQAIRSRIQKARTTLTIRSAISKAEHDDDISQSVRMELASYAEGRIDSIHKGKVKR